MLLQQKLGGGGAKLKKWENIDQVGVFFLNVVFDDQKFRKIRLFCYFDVNSLF
jgi:hypothetical protein